MFGNKHLVVLIISSLERLGAGACAGELLNINVFF
jgi:hypothetical protein